MKRYVVEDNSDESKIVVIGKSYPPKEYYGILPDSISKEDEPFVIKKETLIDGQTVITFEVDQVLRLASHEAKEAKKVKDEKEIKDKSDLKSKKDEFISRGDADEMVFDYIQLLAMKDNPEVFVKASIEVDQDVKDNNGKVVLRKGDTMKNLVEVLAYAEYFLNKANNYFIFRMRNK